MAEPVERPSTLLDNLLKRYEALEDLPIISITQAVRISRAQELSELEVKSCKIDSGINFPGVHSPSLVLEKD